MKTTFKFYFLMIIGTAFLSSLAYGLAGKLVEQNSGVCSFALMVVTVIGLTGMMRTLAPAPSAARRK